MLEDSLLSEPPGKPKNPGVGSLSLLQGELPDPGIELGSPALQVDSIPAEPPGKPNQHAYQMDISIAFVEIEP